MGLESIFLHDKSEEGEMSYRLGYRIAKLFSLFNYDPLKVVKIITDAYSIRSKFVHGGTMTNYSIKNLSSENRDVKILLNKLLGILRISIVIILTMKQSKETLIITLNNSFIDKSCDKNLIQIVKFAKSAFGKMK